MPLELELVNVQNLPPQERGEIDTRIGGLIARYENNSCELNRIIFDCVAALTAGENLVQAINSQSRLKHFFKRITGSNARTQAEINANVLKAQYAAQQILKKLAEQNQMNFELIAAVNNRLSAAKTELDAEINELHDEQNQIVDAVNARFDEIYGTMLEFFSATNDRLQNLKKRVEALEHKTKMHDWLIDIENGDYQDFDDFAKLVYVVRDFMNLTRGDRYETDLKKYLKNAVKKLKLKKISAKRFASEIGRSTSLYSQLLGGELDKFATVYEPIIIDLREAKDCAGRTVFLAQEDAAYAPEFVEVPNDAPEIKAYDFAVELVYSIAQVSYAKDFHDRQERAKEVFMRCEIDTALPLLNELEKSGSVLARYILALIYNEGINVERNQTLARELLAQNISEGDACSIVYGKLAAALYVPPDDYNDACRRLENSTDALECHVHATFAQKPWRTLVSTTPPATNWNGLARKDFFLPVTNSVLSIISAPALARATKPRELVLKNLPRWATANRCFISAIFIGLAATASTLTEKPPWTGTSAPMKKIIPPTNR